MADEQALKNFVADYLQVAVPQLQWQALGGDASFRRYFRVGLADASYIAALAPPATEKNPEFIAIAKGLGQAQVLAPQVLAFDLQAGFMLQNDLGDAVLLNFLDATTVDNYYSQALAQIIAMQAVDSLAMHLPTYSEAVLALELSYFQQWFVEELLQYSLNDKEKSLLQSCFEQLLHSATEQPQAFVHRDYHSRNIMLCDGALATIDFQDALHGPITYDAVSILRDCYIAWPDSKVEAWLRDFHQRWQAANEQAVPWLQFKRWFDWMGLQRHIKVLGIFARLSIRDNKHGYLKDLPQVLSYVLQVAAKYPEMAAFHAWLGECILPLCRKQSWGANL